MSQLSCIILAGGRSRRMGQDKALLTLPDGQCLLGRTVDVARSLFNDEGRWQNHPKGVSPDLAIVTPWPERYQPILTPPIRWVKDTREAGPLVGFSQAWSESQSEWCLLLACDLPNLDGQVLRRWWQWLVAQVAVARWQSHSKGVSPSVNASLVKRSGRWEPLCGYYHRNCIPGLMHHLESDRRDFQSWLQTLNIVPYSAVPDEMLFNCNRPVDWAKITR